MLRFHALLTDGSAEQVVMARVLVLTYLFACLYITPECCGRGSGKEVHIRQFEPPAGRLYSACRIRTSKNTTSPTLGRNKGKKKGQDEVCPGPLVA